MSVEFIPEYGQTLSTKIARHAPNLPFATYISQVPHASLREDQRFVLQSTLLRKGVDQRDRGTCVISFRGTEADSGVLTALDDLGTDVRNFAFRSLPIESDLSKSARFQRNFKHIQDVIEVFFGGFDAVENGHNGLWDFYVTGHSLGGALADTLALTNIVHGGYSFSPPVDNKSGGDRRRQATNPTFRSINKNDKVIGATDTVTKGRTIYDNVVSVPATLANQGGHSMGAFGNEPQTGPFGVPNYNPGNLEYMLPASLVEMPGKAVRRVVNSVSNVAERFSRRIRGKKPEPVLPTLRARGNGSRRRRARGGGPPPTYHMAMKMASDAYNKIYDHPAVLKDELQEADLCPSPISIDEVKFYVVYWPRFESIEDKLAVEPLARIVFGDMSWEDEEMGITPPA